MLRCVGKEKAKFTDAIWTGVLGVIIGAIISFLLLSLLRSILGTIIMIVIWLALIKHFFDCGWIKALVIAIMAGIILDNISDTILHISGARASTATVFVAIR